MQPVRRNASSTPLRYFRPLALVVLGLLGTPAAQAATPPGLCDGFYRVGFVVKEGKTTVAVKPLAEPVKGKRFAEPNFGTCVVRATVHDSEPPVQFARTDYSRRQAFNADNTFFIVNSGDGSWHLYDAQSLKYVSKLSPRVANQNVPAEFHLGGDAEPQWDRLWKTLIASPGWRWRRRWSVRAGQGS